MDGILARIREMRKRLDIIESGGSLPHAEPQDAGATRKVDAIRRRKLARLFRTWQQKREAARLRVRDDVSNATLSSSSDDEVQASPYLAIQTKLRQQLDRLKKVSGKTYQASSSSSTSSSIEAFIAKQTVTKQRTPTQSPQTQSEIKISLSSGSGRMTQSSIKKSGDKVKGGSPVTFDDSSDPGLSLQISDSRPTPSQSLSAILKMASFSDSD